MFAAQFFDNLTDVQNSIELNIINKNILCCHFLTLILFYLTIKFLKLSKFSKFLQLPVIDEHFPAMLPICNDIALKELWNRQLLKK